jgi:hypothetical protein
MRYRSIDIGTGRECTQTPGGGTTGVNAIAAGAVGDAVGVAVGVRVTTGGGAVVGAGWAVGDAGVVVSVSSTARVMHDSDSVLSAAISRNLAVSVDTAFP